MSSLDQCKNTCEQFLRSSLPSISQAQTSLPTIPKFRAVPHPRRNSYKFLEEKQTNWGQLPKDLRRTLLTSHKGQTFVNSLEETLPFSYSIGKLIALPERGVAISYDSGVDLAGAVLVSYLFSAGVGRWKPKIFNQIWHDYVSYFDPEQTTTTYFLYAPIIYMSGVSRRLKLGQGLEIRRLPVDKIAKIASLDKKLAGVYVDHGMTLWPVHFFVKRYEFKKLIINRDADWIKETPMLSMGSTLIEEVAILRSLLHEIPAVPTYAFVRDGYPRDPGGGVMPPPLPWQPNNVFGHTSLTRKDVDKYAQRRTRFLNLEGKPGWESLATSMRRFAVAWENPFRSHILADIVAALEQLVVRDNVEVSYKLRTRVAHFLAKSATERQSIAKSLNVAYGYRSKIFHGGYVFDDAAQWQTATRLKRAKGKKGNPFHDVNEVHRLIYETSNYYRRILESMIDHNQMEIDWKNLGL